MLDLSVIVPTYNRRDYLPQLLEGLARQNYPAERWELIVVSDGSTDDTMEFLNSGVGARPANMTALSQTNAGPGVARNHGAGIAKGRALLFLDDDMVASASLVAEHAQAHIENADAVCIGHLTMPTEGREPWVAWEDAQLTRHFDALKSGRRVPGPRDFYSGNCSVSADLFRRIGGYDATLRRTEDVELGYRLEGAGASFIYRQNADSLHLGRHNFDGWVRLARTYGHSDVVLAWDKGHTELRREIFQWFHLRQAANRALVRVCSYVPQLQQPVIKGLDTAGRVAYSMGVRSVSRACYSAIYNLAYWMSIVDTIGRKQFWVRVGRESPAASRAKYKSSLRDSKA